MSVTINLPFPCTDLSLSVTVSLLTEANSLLTNVCQWLSACWWISVSLLTDVCQLRTIQPSDEYL